LKEQINLRKNGFVVVPSAIDAQLCSNWANQIENSFQRLADEVNCTVNEYLRSVSTWGEQNPLVNEMSKIIQEQVTTSVQEIIGKPVELLECKLLMKGENCPWPTHAHQDISYRLEGGRKQYHFTSWISLTRIGLGQGPLEFLPESHLESISEYQDYINQDFCDRRFSDEWKDRHQKMPIDPGDMIVFDSRVWHASSEWIAIPRRYALIMRWVCPEIPDAIIPQSSSVGITIYGLSDWLEKSLRRLIGISHLEGDALLHACISDETISTHISILLKRYMINRSASKLHGGGAQRGMLYDPLARAVSAEIEKMA